jgi:hypothetical protein
MTNLARCADQVAVNAQQGMLLLDSGWDGNANDAAANYFTSLASSVSDLRFALTDIGDAYKKAANGAWGLALELGNILQALGDYAIVAGIVAVGSPLLLAGGVGVANYAALALIAAKMVQLASSLADHQHWVDRHLRLLRHRHERRRELAQEVRDQFGRDLDDPL